MENAEPMTSMESAEAERASKYVVPRYRAEGDPAWFHVLHGTVPGHQIDFLYCPEVPQGKLEQNHLGHLSRLIKYIEPRQSARYGFALGNLSRDDVKYEPGHGGVALIFALRVAGVTDHAGRAMPPYAHGVLAIDRSLDYATLLEAISVFYRRFLEGDSRDDDATGAFYRSYVRMVQEQPDEVVGFLDDYVANFGELPHAPVSHLALEWEANEELVPKRITIVHADDEPFGNIAHTAAVLGAMLYRSNIKWTTITSGREIEIPGGVSIRFVPVSEAPREMRAPSPRGKTSSQDLRMMSARDPKGLQVSLEDLPQDEAALAHLLFGAKRPEVEGPAPRANWRQALATAKAEDAAATGSNAVPAGGLRASTRPPGLRSTPPGALGSAGALGAAGAGADSASSSYDSGDSSTDVSFDEAATLQAPFEADPGAAPPPAVVASGMGAGGGMGATAAGGVGGAGAFAGVGAGTGAGAQAAFDPRRSSPTKGVPSAFDPRRSSPTTGVAAVGMAGVGISGVGAAGVATGGVGAAGAGAGAGTIGALGKVTLSGGVLPPGVGTLGANPGVGMVAPAGAAPSVDLDSGPRSALTSDPRIESKSRLGIWIGVIGGLAVIVAIAVAIATAGGEASGTSADSASGSTPGAGTSETTAAPQAPTTAAPAGSSSAASSGTGTSAATAASTGSPASTGTPEPAVTSTKKSTHEKSYNGSKSWPAGTGTTTKTVIKQNSGLIRQP